MQESDHIFRHLNILWAELIKMNTKLKQSCNNFLCKCQQGGPGTELCQREDRFMGNEQGELHQVSIDHHIHECLDTKSKNN